MFPKSHVPKISKGRIVWHERLNKSQLQHNIEGPWFDLQLCSSLATCTWTACSTLFSCLNYGNNSAKLIVLLQILNGFYT